MGWRVAILAVAPLVPLTACGSSSSDEGRGRNFGTHSEL
jgi:hypothetical protein